MSAASRTLRVVTTLILLLSVRGFSNSIGLNRHNRLQHFNKNLQQLQVASIETPSSLPDAVVLEKILEVAIDAARKAGVLIRDNIGARVKYSKTNYKVFLHNHYPTRYRRTQITQNTISIYLQDVVTEIDVASQRTIESTIMDAFPSHGFLGEESVEAGHCASIGKAVDFFILICFHGSLF